MSTETELQRQNERFELLLNLTTKITSSLDLREVLRAIAANIREVIHADAVSVSLSDPGSGNARLYAMDFLYGKGVLAGGTNFACKRQRLTTGGGPNEISRALHDGTAPAQPKPTMEALCTFLLTPKGACTRTHYYYVHYWVPPRVYIWSAPG